MRLLADGAPQIRDRHVARFHEPDLYGQLIKRIVVGNIVADQEVVARTFPDGPGDVDVLAIYEVAAGKIAKAWFKTGTTRLLAIRQAAAADADIVRSLTRQAYAKWIPVIGREPVPMTVDYAHAVAAHRVDLLTRDGTPVALIETVPEPDHLLVENLAVTPDCQGHGYGRRLMAHAEALAASGHRLIRLYTNKLFADNLRFYQSLGYGIDREEPFRGGTTVYLSKRLA